MRPREKSALQDSETASFRAREVGQEREKSGLQIPKMTKADGKNKLRPGKSSGSYKQNC